MHVIEVDCCALKVPLGGSKLFYFFSYFIVLFVQNNFHFCYHFLFILQDCLFSQSPPPAGVGGKSVPFSIIAPLASIFGSMSSPLTCCRSLAALSLLLIHILTLLQSKTIQNWCKEEARKHQRWVTEARQGSPQISAPHQYQRYRLICLSVWGRENLLGWIEVVFPSLLTEQECIIVYKRDYCFCVWVRLSLWHRAPLQTAAVNSSAGVCMAGLFVGRFCQHNCVKTEPRHRHKLYRFIVRI